MAPQPAAPRICVAQIGAPHGVRGEVKLFSFTGDPLAVKDYGPLQAEHGALTVEIEALRPAKGHLIARLAGVNDREAAARLVNTRLYVSRERLPQPPAGEFYHADLVGLAVVDKAGAAVGKVVAIHNFGAGDLIEVALGDGGATALLPFTEATVPVVDLAGGRLVIDPPQGLFGD